MRAGLKLNHLRMIVAIEDQRADFSAAADALNISQPAASRMLAEIESILKTPLCERVARGVDADARLDEALARRARTILLELREASREIAELKTGKGGSVFTRLRHRRRPSTSPFRPSARFAPPIPASRSTSRSRTATCWRANFSPPGTTSSSAAFPTNSTRGCST